MKNAANRLALAVSVLTGLSSGPLLAQNVLEEVVVSARLQTETLFEVPVAVTVLSDEFFRDTGFNTIEEIAKFVPGFDFSPTNTSRASGAQIRGISTFSFSDGFESSVATVIDGVVMGREAQGFFDLYDIESLEVIKGPQGTLFGKNASAGVVNVRTKRPEYEFSAGGDFMVGTFNETRVRGSVTGPIVDDVLAYRLTGSRHVYDGKLDNAIPGNDDVNDKDTWSLRGKLMWDPSERLNVLFTADYVEEDNACCQPTYRNAGDPNIVFEFAINPGAQQLQNALADIGIQAGEGNREVGIFDTRIGQISESSGFSAEVNYDLGWASLTSITAVRDWEIDEFNEADGVSLSNINDRNGTMAESTQESQEFRLFGSIGEKASYVAGLYYFHEEVDADGTVFVELALPFPPFLNSATRAVRNVETTNYSVFGEATFDLTDKFSLIVGGRLTNEEKEASYTRISSPIIAAFPFSADATFGPDISGTQEVDDTDFSGRIIGRYTFSDNLSTYLTYSEGYKGAGIDVAESVNVALIENEGGLPILAPEIPTLIELGIKGRYLDGALSFNAALFTQTVENFQAITADEQGVAQNTGIDEVLSEGLEIDFTWLPQSLTGLSFMGSATFLDATYEEFGIRPSLEGEKVSNVPERQFSLVGNYDFDLGSTGYTGFGRLEYTWQDDKNTDLLGANPLNDIDSYGLLNIRLGLNSPSGRYKALLSVENATDEDYPHAVFGTAYAFFDGASRAQYLGDERIIRLTLGFDL